MDDEITDNRDEKGKFISGNKAGPGRPKGSKNVTTLVNEAINNKCAPMLAKHVPKVLKVVINQAEEGCRKSQKMVLDRVVPIQKAADPDQFDADNTITINVGLLTRRDEEDKDVIEGSFKEET